MNAFGLRLLCKGRHFFLGLVGDFFECLRQDRLLLLLSHVLVHHFFDGHWTYLVINGRLFLRGNGLILSRLLPYGQSFPLSILRALQSLFLSRFLGVSSRLSGLFLFLLILKLLLRGWTAWLVLSLLDAFL